MRKPKVLPEKKFRKEILRTAKRLGCDIEVQKILDRTDNLLKSCTNSVEKKQIAYLGICELHKFLDCTGNLEIDGKEVIPAKKIENENKIIV